MEFVLKALAMGGFIAFLAVLPIWVPDIDLIVVLALAVGMAFYDFFIRPIRWRLTQTRLSHRGIPSDGQNQRK